MRSPSMKPAGPPMDRGGYFDVLAFRNPIGELMITGPVLFLNYLRERDHLLAYRALVSLQLDLRVRGITEDDAIRQAVAEAGLVHRLTGEMAVWDEERRMLAYPASADFDDEEFSVRF